MRSTTIYHKDGTKTVIEGGQRTYAPSYDSAIDKPFHQRVLDAYQKLEARGELRQSDFRKPGSKAFVRRVHERALAQGL